MKCALLFLAIILVAAAPTHAQTRKRIIAGPIEIAGNRISGDFRVQQSSRSGIQSLGTGGACLVAELGKRACRTPDDCSALATEYQPDGSAYCLPAAGKSRRSTCWVRGADLDYCRKSPKAPLPLDTKLHLPDVDPHRLSRAHGIRWRVLACLNTYDATTQADNRGCADPAGLKPKSTSVGPPRRIR